VWASVDLPPAPDVALGIVPAPWDDRFAAQADACSASASCWVRGVMGQAAIVSAAAAAEGVTITNPSDADPIVMLKHFGPDAHDNMPDIG